MDIVVLGELLWDLFDVSATGALEHARARRTYRRELGGAAGNLATALARLGVRVAVVGAVGADRFGDELRAHLQADGVNTRFVLPCPRRTGLTFVSRDAHGEPTFLSYRAASAELALTAGHITPAMGRARWIVVGSSTLAAPSLAAATRRFVAAGRRSGARVALDLNARAHQWPSRAAMSAAVGRLARGVDLVKASEADLVALAGGDARDGVAWLRAHCPRATWLVTRGRAPASAVGAHGQVTRPAKRARCLDATGAGDAFFAGALGALCAADVVPGAPGWDDPRLWSAVLDVAHRMGAKAVSRVGGVAGLTRLAVPLAQLSKLREAAAKS